MKKGDIYMVVDNIQKKSHSIYFPKPYAGHDFDIGDLVVFDRFCRDFNYPFVCENDEKSDAFCEEELFKIGRL